jgi:hypothetical protein
MYISIYIITDICAGTYVLNNRHMFMYICTYTYTHTYSHMFDGPGAPITYLRDIAKIRYKSHLNPGPRESRAAHLFFYVLRILKIDIS